MEQKNLNLSNEAQEVMPSYFKSLTTSESIPLPDWNFLLDSVRKSQQLKAYTELYRKRLAISKRYADELKATAPAITASILVDGYGRKFENIVKPTYKFLIDIDKVPSGKMEQIGKLIKGDDHTLFANKTVGGRGYHIICRYEPLDDEDITVLELFEVMIGKAMRYYAELLGIMPDKACIDITRCAGLAYDPDAYLNTAAIPFTLCTLDLKALYTKKAKAEHKGKKRNAPKAAPKNAPAKGAPTMDEAANHIKDLLAAWGYVFEPGHHNDYVVNFAKVCVLYDIDPKEALLYGDREFGKSYPETSSVIKSCYKHTERLGLWHFYREGEGYSQRPSVKVIKQWLSTRYEFHHNVVTGFYEVRSLFVLKGKYPRWTQLDDSIENSIWSEMDEAGLHTSTKMLSDIINSDFSEPFDPLDDYLRNLTPWHSGDPDYIDELASRIEVENLPDSHHTPALFRYFFKKWMVAMVIGWCVLKVVNQITLILVGKGGIFKTTFFAWLLPPQLRPYFMNDSTGSYTDKDFMEAFSSKALLCLDEFESVFGKNLSAFKSNITKLTFSIRRPYDKYRSELPHRASVCGTTNTVQFITDEENRRYCPWIVRSIVSPMEEPIDYDHVFAQALALGQQVMRHKKDEPLDWTYWLTPEDIQTMRLHNRLFMVANYAEEQILRFYKIPTEDTDKRFIKFRYNAEILEKIGCNPALRQKLSNQDIGAIMARLGFKKVHRRKGNGWAVIEKDGAEINTDSML